VHLSSRAVLVAGLSFGRARAGFVDQAPKKGGPVGSRAEPTGPRRVRGPAHARASLGIALDGGRQTCGLNIVEPTEEIGVSGLATVCRGDVTHPDLAAVARRRRSP